MKPWRYLLLWALTVLGPAIRAQDSQFAREFGPTWQRATAYTLAVAEAMPDSLYGYRPTPEVFTFAEHLLHLEQNLYSLRSRFVQPQEVAPPAPPPATKAAIMARLALSLAAIDELLQGLSDAELRTEVPDFWGPDPITKAGIILLMRDHMTHHRGQLILYLRLNGIEPPRYQGW